MSSILELWDPAPSDAKIAGDEVHILSANLQQPATPTDLMWDTLSSDEQRRAERFRFERDRARFIKGRSLLREILGWYLATEPAQLRFTYSSKGKPALAEPWAASRIDFNVAHSEGIALYALACGREVGVVHQPYLESIRHPPSLLDPCSDTSANRARVGRVQGLSTRSPSLTVTAGVHVQ